MQPESNCLLALLFEDIAFSDHMMPQVTHDCHVLEIGLDSDMCGTTQECDDEIEQEDGKGAQLIFRIVRIPFQVAFVSGNLKLRLHVEQNSKTRKVRREWGLFCSNTGAHEEDVVQIWALDSTCLANRRLMDFSLSLCCR